MIVMGQSFHVAQGQTCAVLWTSLKRVSSSKARSERSRLQGTNSRLWLTSGKATFELPSLTSRGRADCLPSSMLRIVLSSGLVEGVYQR